jgi:hypothetical protein
MQTLNTLDLMQVNGGIDDAAQKPDFSNVVSRVAIVNRNIGSPNS